MTREIIPEEEVRLLRQELKEALQQLCAKKRAKKMKKGKRIKTIAAGPQDEVPAYDPQNPHYRLNEYYAKESYSDRGTVETEESMADNFTKAELS